MTNFRHAPGDLWPLLDLQKSCSEQDQSVSYMHAQFHLHIHHRDWKSEFLAKIPNFARIIAPDDLDLREG